jgi:CRP-like cAMP-binding protein
MNRKKEKPLPLISSYPALEDIFAFWDALTHDERLFLKNNCTVHFFKRRELVHKEGYMPTHVMLLATGKLKAYKTGLNNRVQIIRLLKPGEHFGYRGVIANQPYNSNVAAVEPSTVYMFKADLFLSILRHNNAMCYRFLEETSYDLGTADLRTLSLTQKHIRGRLAEALLQLKETYGFDKDGATISIYLSRDELAYMSNMTTANVIRTLAAFAAEQIIAIDGKKLKIINEEKLIIASKFG